MSSTYTYTFIHTQNLHLRVLKEKESKVTVSLDPIPDKASYMVHRAVLPGYHLAEGKSNYLN